MWLLGARDSHCLAAIQHNHMGGNKKQCIHTAQLWLRQADQKHGPIMSSQPPTWPYHAPSNWVLKEGFWWGEATRGFGVQSCLCDCIQPRDAVTVCAMAQSYMTGSQRCMACKQQQIYCSVVAGIKTQTNKARRASAHQTPNGSLRPGCPTGVSTTGSISPLQSAPGMGRNPIAELVPRRVAGNPNW